MDYKYIEQLLERYWNCETSLEEEKILHSFFAQKDVPIRLLPYRELFLGQQMHQEECLGNDFDKRILALTEEKEKQGKSNNKVKAQTVTRTYTLRPFFQAAACVAVVLCLGMAVQQASLHNESDTQIVESNTRQIAPTATPETAYGGDMEALPTDTALTKATEVNL